MIDKNEFKRLLIKFKSCGPIFIALGDEIRQNLILDIVNAGSEGINVTDLASRTKLSRPAISHHLKVLKDCGLINPIKMGTQIFYKLNMKEKLSEASDLFQSIQNVIQKINLKEASLSNMQPEK
ncbi:MAG: metalloregulator ArsR/SmtB family transcription factor [Treponema sp.]